MLLIIQNAIRSQSKHQIRDCTKNKGVSSLTIKTASADIKSTSLLPPNKYMAPVEDRYTPAEPVLGGV